jgi:hypothetical protein
MSAIEIVKAQYDAGYLRACAELGVTVDHIVRASDDMSFEGHDQEIARAWEEFAQVRVQQ